MRNYATCKAITKSGRNCNLRAGTSGYCHIHDPAKKAQHEDKQKTSRKQKEESTARGAILDRVINEVKDICRAKGWTSSVTHRDLANARFASIEVERSYLATSYWPEVVKGFIEVSIIDEQVRYSFTRVSQGRRGLQDLFEAIRQTLGLKEIKSSGSTKSSRNEHSNLISLERLIKRFHLVVQQLRYRHNNRETLRVDDEYDVQDLLHALLKISFDDVRIEEYTPSYAGGSSRVDFLLKNEQIVIEVKMTNSRLKEKQVGDQLIIDIKRYQSHPDCKILVCFVYDPMNHIRNPNGLEKDLSRKHDNLLVHVFVVPRSQG